MLNGHVKDIFTIINSVKPPLILKILNATLLLISFFAFGYACLMIFVSPSEFARWIPVVISPFIAMNLVASYMNFFSRHFVLKALYKAKPPKVSVDIALAGAALAELGYGAMKALKTYSESCGNEN